MVDTVFSPQAMGFDTNIHLLREAIFQTDEEGYANIPIKNVSEHYIGLLENDEISDAEIIDIGKAKPLAALAMDSEWGEEQLAKMTPALREVAQKEAIRQMSKVGHEFDQPAAEDARPSIATVSSRTTTSKCRLQSGR